MILYHADITNDNTVSVYQPKPPEETRKRLILFVYKGLWMSNKALGGV
jgi:hypothetical protein